MNIDTERLKERMIALIDEGDKTYVTSLLDDLENVIHEHSFDSGYDMGYVNGLMADLLNELEVEYNQNNGEMSLCHRCNI